MMTYMIALSLIGQGTADPAATFSDYQKKLREAQSVSGKMSYGAGENQMTFVVRMMKPNLFSLVSEQQEMRSDGETMWTYMPGVNQYMKSAAPAVAPMVPGLEIFFDPKEMPYKFENPRASTFEEKAAVSVDLRVTDDMVAELILNPETVLPTAMRFDAGGQMITFRYSDLKVNDPEVTREGFKWSPPEGATEREQPDYMANMIKVGEEAPDFTLAKTDGSRVNLKNGLEGRKGVLLNFWFYG